jgi:hypothetical protein
LDFRFRLRAAEVEVSASEAGSELESSESHGVLVGEALGGDGDEVGAEGGAISALEVDAIFVTGGEDVGSWMGSKPVPSDGSSSVPSPSLSFSVRMACIRRVSNAKSLMDEAMDFDISHGENALPERVYIAK